MCLPRHSLSSPPSLGALFWGVTPLLLLVLSPVLRVGCVQAMGPLEILENEPEGHFITNMAHTQLATTTGKTPSEVTIKSELVRLRPNWDLVTSRVLDREAICADMAEDACEADLLFFTSNPFKSERLVLRILDTNDNAPLFARDSLHMHMPENTPVGGNWALDIAKDPDSVENGVVGYSLECEGCVEDAQGVFLLSDDERRSSDGAVLPKLQLVAPLDHEETQLFTLKVTASDKDGNSDWYYVLINVTDINDNAPIFSQSSLKLTIPEDQPVGSVVGSVYATDLDSGRNGEIEYGFSTQESLPETVRCFSIDPHTGQITLTQSLKNQGGKNHEVIIFARDKALSPMKDELTWTFSILEKNDFVPQISFVSLVEDSDPDCEIPENNNPGQVIGYFEVTDKDEGVFGETEFFMVNGSNLFQLKEESGFYFVSLLDRFDRETQDHYVITVRALDCKGDATCDRLESTKAMLFRVCDENDNEPVFVDNEITLTLTEESVPGFLAQFEAFDKDKGPNGQVEFFIPKVPVSDSFNVDNNTGSVSSVLPLDRELLGNVFEVPIAARDKGVPQRTTRARLIIILEDINDNPPRFLHRPKFLETFENSLEGMVIGTVEAVDDDTENSDIKYALTSNSSKFFAIDIEGRQGKIKTLKTFDYEDQNNREFKIWVVAKEDSQEGLQSILPLVIKVIDRNDNYPVIDYMEKFVEVPWDADDGFEVTHVVAHDDDSDENGRLKFRLVSEHDRFDINSKTGLLYVRERPQQSIFSDRDQTFEVVVEVADCASSIDSLSAEDSVFVTFSGNVTLYNHTKVPAINIPMTLSDIERFIIHIAIGALLLFIIIIILFVLLVKKCSGASGRRATNHRAAHLAANGKLMRGASPEEELQFNTRRSLGGGSSHSQHLGGGSTLLQQGGGHHYSRSGVPGQQQQYLLSSCSNVDCSVGGADDFSSPPSSKEVSPNCLMTSATVAAAHLDDSSVVFANEMHRGSVANIHENPLAAGGGSLHHPGSGHVTSAAAAATTFSPSAAGHRGGTGTRGSIDDGGSIHHNSNAPGGAPSSPVPPRAKQEQLCLTSTPTSASTSATSMYTSPPYSLGGYSGDVTGSMSKQGTLGCSPSFPAQGVGVGHLSLSGGNTRRQVSEPVSMDHLSHPLSHSLASHPHPLCPPSDSSGGGGVGGGVFSGSSFSGGSSGGTLRADNRRLNALTAAAAASNSNPTAVEDVRSSGSPEPANSDSSSFDSGRGSEAQMPMDALSSALLQQHNPSHPLSTIRGVKSLPSGKKCSGTSRHVAPSPMFGDYREDDCWQPRTTGAGASSTLPPLQQSSQQVIQMTNNSAASGRQVNNPDVPTKGGILITPARQILQPPASNHEKWNLPREGNTFKHNATAAGASSPQPPQQNNNQGSQSAGAGVASATSISRNGSTVSELETIAENFALERGRDSRVALGGNMQSEPSSNQISPTQSLLHMHSYTNTPTSQSSSTAPGGGVPNQRSSLPPKRTPPSIPIDPNSQSESRTAVV